MLEVGIQVQDFCLPNQDEEEICLRDIKGKMDRALLLS